MAKIELTTQVIKELANILKDSGLGSMAVKNESFSIEIQSKDENIVVNNAAAPPLAVPAGSVPPAAQTLDESEKGNVVVSPIIGTFYSAPAPDKDPFVRAGQTVHKGDVLFIIESMKLMNEVTSDYDGVVRKICVENGAPVEYGQPIMIIE